MKKKPRKSYTTAFKVKVALEAIKGQRTINEIATHYGVQGPAAHASQFMWLLIGEQGIRHAADPRVHRRNLDLDWLQVLSATARHN